MAECLHNHLIRDENIPSGYSCESCGALFEVELVGEAQASKPVMGIPADNK